MRGLSCACIRREKSLIRCTIVANAGYPRKEGHRALREAVRTFCEAAVRGKNFVFCGAAVRGRSCAFRRAAARGRNLAFYKAAMRGRGRVCIRREKLLRHCEIAARAKRSRADGFRRAEVRWRGTAAGRTGSGCGGVRRLRKAQLGQGVERVAPQGVELRNRKKGVRIGMDRHISHPIGRPAGLAQLRFGALAVEFPAVRGFDGRADSLSGERAVRDSEFGWPADAQRQFGADGNCPAFDRGAFPRCAHLGFGNQADQPVAALRAGAADGIARETGQPDRPVGVGRSRLPMRILRNWAGAVLSAPARRRFSVRCAWRGGFRLAQRNRAEHQRVLRIDVGVQPDPAVLRRAADLDAQVVWPRGEHQLRIVHAVKIPLREAAAIEHLLKRQRVARRGGLVDRGAIGGGDGGDVFGALQPALDLEAVDAGLAQIVQRAERAEILRREQIAVRVLHPVAHPARLSAAAAVSATPADHSRKQALPRAGHAQRAVDKRFQFDSRIRARLNLGQGHLAGEHGAGEAVSRQKFHTGAVVRGHLRAGVQREPRRDGAHRARDAEVLNERGVRAGGGDRFDGAAQGGELVLADHRVQRDVDAHAARMAIANRLRQLIGRKVAGAVPGIEIAHAEVDGVRAVLHGGDERGHAARRGEQLGFTSHRPASPVLRAGVRFPRGGGGSRRAI